MRGLSSAEVRSFAFSAAPDARVLILGSMPGAESLRRQQYYGHPQNLFWGFMGRFFGAGPALVYAERLARLRDGRVALWDVAHRCRRPGSLDSSIERGSVEPNDFAALFALCPVIHSVFFNGTKAAELFRRLVLPTLEPPQAGLSYEILPSTSPANASIPRAVKLARWGVVKRAAARPVNSESIVGHD
ncbi:MAG: DNA-deoxyinosine glycosylase [Gammaproteobacteria bacterium]|nr:DNA-deoxyinosine glycosylase [Gammaproteobacteria bacterium]